MEYQNCKGFRNFASSWQHNLPARCSSCRKIAKKSLSLAQNRKIRYVSIIIYWFNRILTLNERTTSRKINTLERSMQN
jgi:hypothetical protein